MQRRWIFPAPPDPLITERLLRELEVPSFLAALLARRGFSDPTEADSFLHPKLRFLQSPELLPEMDTAVARVLEAVNRKERIVLYGDYDVDGITSLALLARVLQTFRANVACFLPHRVVEGYGLSEEGVERCCEMHQPELLIAADCGTTSVREIANLHQRGVDVVVLDHHELGPTRPPCIALVNPKCGQDFHYLCSAGIAFKLAHAMLKQSSREELDLREYLDLVALATIADLAPLVQENRIFVRFGLRQMAVTRWVGIHALMKVSGTTPPIRGSDVGFRLGPRINAAGRLGPAQEALRLLLTDDSAEALRIASSLDVHNRERQNLERMVAREADEWVGKNFDSTRDTTIVVGQRDWHVGVVGIVASRVVKRYHRPTFIVGFDEEGSGKGSGRSIEGVSLVSLLRVCSDHLEKYGGHDMAAGVTIHEKAFPAFREAFESAAREIATEELLTPRLLLDAEIELHDLAVSLLEAQDSIEPFGVANPQPLLFTRAISPLGTPRVMKEKHLRIEFSAGRRRISAVFFNVSLDALPRPPWDVAYTLDWNSWQGRAEAQMRIVDVQRAE